MTFSDLVPAATLAQKTQIAEGVLSQWRQNFGFPFPVTSSNGRRGYTQEQIDQIMLIKQLMGAGVDAAVVVGKPLGHLECLVASLESNPARKVFALEIRTAIAFVESGQFENLAAHLKAQKEHRSLSEFVEQIAAPFMEAVGESWALGKIAVYQEHLCTDIMLRMLSTELGNLQPDPHGPRILFATPINELHGLGNLMARCVLSDFGANAIGLGTQMPNGEIVKAAMAWQSEIVALSFSFSYPGEKVTPLVWNLREMLLADVELWIGGAGAKVLDTAGLAGVRLFFDLQSPVEVLKRKMAGKAG